MTKVSPFSSHWVHSWMQSVVLLGFCQVHGKYHPLADLLFVTALLKSCYSCYAISYTSVWLLQLIIVSRYYSSKKTHLKNSITYLADIRSVVLGSLLRLIGLRRGFSFLLRLRFSPRFSFVLNFYLYIPLCWRRQWNKIRKVSFG